ncbi:hypothetical protein [Desulfobacula sp.]|uniref:hypothetical protein n=1 Tax=Desulfobacula sp. TaxID=2593537 RepID=UPI00261A2117|nr:hypothetical protein [Desulfobacula sp.]
METMDTDKAAKKAAMKDLRAQRKDLIEAASLQMKKQKKDIKAIEAFLTGRAATIPDIAQGIGLPTDKTLWYIASLKKYGRIVEGSKAGAFFNYALNEPANNTEQEEV